MHLDNSDKCIENFYDYLVKNCADLNEAIRTKREGGQGVTFKCPVAKFVGDGKNINNCD